MTTITQMHQNFSENGDFLWNYWISVYKLQYLYDLTKFLCIIHRRNFHKSNFFNDFTSTAPLMTSFWIDTLVTIHWQKGKLYSFFQSFNRSQTATFRPLWHEQKDGTPNVLGLFKKHLCHVKNSSVKFGRSEGLYYLL